MEILNEITTPIGTLEELKEIGADPRKVRSCHERTGAQAGGILGCPHFRMCRFRQWRDQQNGLKGPLNVGVEITLSQIDGRHTAQSEMACYNYYAANIRQRQRQQEESGELIRIVAYEGDGKMISEKETRRVKGEPKESPLMEPYMNVHPVTPHKRPIERFPVVAAAHIASEERMDDVEREALRNVLAKAGISKSETPQPDAEPPVVGEPVKVRKHA